MLFVDLLVDRARPDPVLGIGFPYEELVVRGAAGMTTGVDDERPAFGEPPFVVAQRVRVEQRGRWMEMDAAGGVDAVLAEIYSSPGSHRCCHARISFPVAQKTRPGSRGSRAVSYACDGFAAGCTVAAWTWIRLSRRSRTGSCCCGPGRLKTCRRSSPPVTRRRSRAGSIRSRARTVSETRANTCSRRRLHGPMERVPSSRSRSALMGESPGRSQCTCSTGTWRTSRSVTG